MTRQPQRMPGKLLELFLPANAALAGDLVEEYERRGSALWYWRQVLSAIAIAVAWSIYNDAMRLLRPSSIPASFQLVRLILTPLPLLILIGGFGRSIPVGRRNGHESITA